jgi:glycosyltransferase involved in cell wall biosynthesis
VKDPSHLRVAWFADIFDEVSGVITDTEEMYELAREQKIFWQPVTTYPKPLYPFHCFPHIIKIPTGKFYKDSYNYVPTFARVTQYLRKQEINLVVSNTPGMMGMAAMAAAEYLRLPWVDIYHTDVDFYMDVLSGGLLKPVINRAALMVLKQYQKMADLIFVRTQEYYDLQIKKGHPAKKLRFYPAGVNVDHWNPKYANQDIWERYGLKSEDNIVLFVGRITKVKDIQFLLDYFKEKKPKKAQLVLVGGGPELNEYQEKYESSANITFLGIRRGLELQEIYSSADLYVLPSASETLGKTVLEAMASGTPVLVSDKGGPKDYVQENESGCIFKAYDFNSFSERLNYLLSNCNLKEMGEKARENSFKNTDKDLFKKFTSDIAELL